MECNIKINKIENEKNIEIYANRSFLPFRFLDVIGQGKIGTVYKSFDIEKRKIVAIKEIGLNQYNDENLHQLKNEINIMNSLKNENIIKMFGLCLVEKSQLEPVTLYIVMEYVPKGSLDTHIKLKGALTEDQAKISVKDLLKGLEYMHLHGIVHRDLKCKVKLNNRFKSVAK